MFARELVVFRLGLTLAITSVVLFLCGCVTDQEKIDAINDVNREFRRQYEEIIKEDGTRQFDATEMQAFIAMENSLRDLGMRIEAQDSSVGYIRSVAPAPNPLTSKEWEEASAVDIERMRAIIVDNVGVLGYFVTFEPEGLEIVINVTTEKKSNKAEVSVTVRMRETKPPKTGWPRREYPPPTAMRLGIKKFWSSFEKELRRVKSIQ